MKNVLELLYDSTYEWEQASNVRSPEYEEQAQIQNDNLEKLMKSLSDPQKQWLDDFFQADVETSCILQLDKFRYAFHLGAQLALELERGRKLLLGD